MTREDSSRLLVAVTGALVFAAAAVFAGIERGPVRAEAGPPTPPPEAGPPAAASPDTVPAAQDSALVAQGRELFRSVGCTGCHAAEGEGSRRIPLDGVGSRLSADTLRAWVVDPRSVAPSVRKPAYDDLPDDEVNALVAYMLSLTEGG